LAEPAGAATIVEVLHWQASHQADKRAFVFLERGEREAAACTFAELDARARLIAGTLLSRGLAGERIVLAYPTCIEFIAALFGCFYAGAVAIPAPADGSLRAVARLTGILADSQAAAVLTLRPLLDRLVEPGADAHGALSARHCILTDELRETSEAASLRAATPQDVALLQYTSGSTGNPRGVILTHGNLISNQRTLSTLLRSTPADIGMTWLPLYHDMGLIGAVLHSIYCGGFSALMPPLAFVQRPIRWLQAIDRYRASISIAPGFAYGLAASRAQRVDDTRLDLSCWRAALCGGESIRPETLEQFVARFQPMGFDARALMPAYGLAEATLLATASPPGTGLITLGPPVAASSNHLETAKRRLVSCGLSAAGQRLLIVDPASGAPVPPGQLGEIWLQGPSVAAGYWNRPEESRATFGAALAQDDGGTWLRTGDLGFMCRDGLVVTGRSKETIVIHGANYDPLDIETVACDSDAALAAGSGAAFSVARDEGESLVLLYELAHETASELNLNALAGRVINSVNAHFGLRLHDLMFLRPRSLPRTTSGKLQRLLSKEQYLTGELQPLGAITHPALGRQRPRSRVPT
jgi:acyl-CoA synthetase (AMP-forming)/AMP-acid ligase II